MKARRVLDKPPPGMLSHIGPIIERDSGYSLKGRAESQKIFLSTVPPFFGLFFIEKIDFFEFLTKYNT